MAMAALDPLHIRIADSCRCISLSMAHHEILIAGPIDIALNCCAVPGCDRCPGFLSDTQPGNLDFDLFDGGRLLVSLLTGTDCLQSRPNNRSPANNHESLFILLPQFESGISASSLAKP